MKRLGAAVLLAVLGALSGGVVNASAHALEAQSAVPSQSAQAVPASSSSGRTSYDLRASYVVDVTIDWPTRHIDVTTDMDAWNTSGGTVTRLELNTVAARLGSIDLVAAAVDGHDVRPTISDQTILVTLPHALAIGDHVWVHTRYRARLLSDTANHDWLWSETSNVAAAYRFIPWLSRLTPFDRPNFGDPFVTPVAEDVRVTFHSTTPLLFATSGVEIASGEHGVTFDARNVRDFNFAASPAYSVLNGKTRDGKAEIRVVTAVASDARAKHMLQLARRVIAQYEAWVGPYPYETITLAETGRGVGMESPGMVWIPRDQTANAYLIAHELGHQWFYAVDGNDEARDPFFDEAMTDFLARTFLHELRGSRCPTARLDLSIYRYSGACYYETIYIQGSLFINGIRRQLGDSRFWSTVRAFWSANRFTVSSSRAFLEAFRAAAGNVLLPRYRARFPSLYPS